VHTRLINNACSAAGIYSVFSEVLIRVIYWRRVQIDSHVMKQFMAKTDSLLIGITAQLQLCRLLHTIKTRNFTYYWNRK